MPTSPSPRRSSTNDEESLIPSLGLRHLALGAGLSGAIALYFTLKSDRPRDQIKAAYTDENSSFKSIHGMEVHYRDTGHGPPLLLLHGTASSLHTWDRWAEVLSSHFRVIRMDLPGFGLTGPDPRNRYHLDDYVDFLETFRLEFDLDGFHLAGNSFGGKIAWNYAADHGELVKKLVLVDSMGFMKSWKAPFSFFQAPLLGRTLKTLTPRWVIQSFVKSLYSRPERLSDEVLDRYFELLLAEGNREALYHRLNTPIKRSENRLSSVNVPTLIQWGTDDPLIPANHANRFNKLLPNSSVITYLGAGHMPMEEIPDQTASDVKSFLT